MKKTLIALAVAGALTAPMVAQADATLYGSVGVNITDVDGGELNVTDGDSYIGVKGDVAAGEGLRGIYQLEWAIDAGDSGNTGTGRVAYAGLEGGFGTVVGGRLVAPHYSMVTGVTDILEARNAQGVTQNIERVGSTVAYFTPEMGGFKGAVAFTADDNASGKDLDVINLAATYSFSDVTVGASKVMDKVNNDSDTTALSVAYTGIDNVYLAALYQDKEATDVSQYELAGSYTMGDVVFAGSYADLDNDGTVVGLEVQKKLGSQAHVFASYQDANDEAGLVGENDAITLGYQINF